MVTAVRGAPADPRSSSRSIWRCWPVPLPISVADLASDLDLPLGVVRILLCDLRERSLISDSPPHAAGRLPDPQILKEVADGLRRL